MTSPTESPRGELLIEGLSVTIPKPAGEIRVLEDVSLDVPAGRAVALVGGSGAGKSMTACAVILPAVPNTDNGELFISAHATSSPHSPTNSRRTETSSTSASDDNTPTHRAPRSTR